MKYLFNVETSIAIDARDQDEAYAILNGEPIGNDWWVPGEGGKDFDIDSDVLGHLSRRTLDRDVMLVEVSDE
jgi:hypothetical protein